METDEQPLSDSILPVGHLNTASRAAASMRAKAGGTDEADIGRSRHEGNLYGGLESSPGGNNEKARLSLLS